MRINYNNELCLIDCENILIKTIKRIKLSNKFIKISINILQNKETKIINKYNSPNKIQIKSNIDQGDSISYYSE